MRCFSLLIAITATLLATATSAQQIAKPAKESESLTAAAEKTYALLLSDYRINKTSGPLQLELLNNWSKRILTAQFVASGFVGLGKAEFLAEAQQQHRKRAAALEEIVLAKALTDKATATEVAASKFFRLEGEQIVSSAREFLRQSEAELANRKIEIRLPPATEAKPLTIGPKPIVVSVRSDGTYYVAGKILSEENLGKLLQDASQKNPAQSLLLLASREAPFRFVATVIALCKHHGMRHWMRIEPRK